MKLRFETPGKERELDAINFVEEFQKANSDIHGSGGLDINRYDEWLQKVKDYHNGIIHNPEHSSASTYFVVDEQDKVIGMVNIRHYLTKHLTETGSGHVGYSVRPTERRKGYATKILEKAITILKENYNQTEIMVGCYEDNIGSKRTIEKNGGIHTNTVTHDGKPSLVYIINT